jgi:isoleucyl-tRNA synthetase
MSEEIPKQYDPSESEAKWYAYWEEHDYFHSEPDEREPFTIVIPPPNVTGVLHMGHMLNNTIQDVLVRRARMTGKERLLGARNRPRLYRHRGQSGAASARKRDQKVGHRP